MRLAYLVSWGIGIQKTILIITIITNDSTTFMFRQKRAPISSTVCSHSGSGSLKTTARIRESNGKHRGVYGMLYVCSLMLPSPLQGISAVKDNKGDKKDTKWIGDFL